MLRTLHILIAAGAVGLASPEAVPAAVQTSVSVVPSVESLDFDNGLKVDLSSYPVTVGLHTERLTLHATFPYEELNAQLPTYEVGGPVLHYQFGGQEINEEGPGDVVLTPSILALRGSFSRPWIWAGLRIKAPTADRDKYLGTGELDYGPGIGVLQPCGTRLGILLTARYDVRGDPPDMDLQNTWGGTFGTVIRIATLDFLTVTFDRSESYLPQGEPVNGAALAWQHPLRNGFSLQFVGISDLSSSLRGYGAGLGFVYHENPFQWGG